MKIGVAADHGGFELKRQLAAELARRGHEVTDFGAENLRPEDDYPDYVIPLARAVAQGRVERGIAVCGSGVGASVVANKIAGVRAGLVSDAYSAHQGVEDDDMNVLCLGGRVTCFAPAWEFVEAFLGARFRSEERFRRRLDKVRALEREEGTR